MRRHVIRSQHVMPGGENPGESRVPMWHMAFGVACQRRKRRPVPMARKRIDQGFQVRSMAFATLKRVGEYLADDLIVLSLAALAGHRRKLLGGRHGDGRSRDHCGMAAFVTVDRSRRALEERSRCILVMVVAGMLRQHLVMDGRGLADHRVMMAAVAAIEPFAATPAGIMPCR